MTKDFLDTLRKIQTEFSLSSASQESVPTTNPDDYDAKIACITSIDESKNRIQVRLIAGDYFTDEFPVIYPGFMGTPDGAGFWHGLSVNDVVTVTLAQGKRWIITNKLNNVASNQINGTRVFPQDEDIGVPVKEGSYGFRAKLQSPKQTIGGRFMSVMAVPGDGIHIGAPPFSSLFFDYFPDTNGTDKSSSVVSLQGGQLYSFSESGYSVAGIALRPSQKPSNEMLDPHDEERWYRGLSAICLDPSRIKSNVTDKEAIRNPPFNEEREVTYEFAESSGVDADSIEKRKQMLHAFEDTNAITISRSSSSRRNRKYDTLSLSLVSPNQLMERAKGTLIDIYGNVLDLNRQAIPVGSEQLAGLDGTEKSFDIVRALHRKGVAHHFELNARKDPKEDVSESGIGKEYGATSGSYKRERSRLFFDIDKEGQFKINIPASSEVGNVGLLVRYENASTINAVKDNYGTNYDTFVQPEKGKSDILVDEFGVGCVALKGNEKLVPTDRITSKPVKLGTAFHDISKTCCEPIYPTGNAAGSPGKLLEGKGPAIFAGPDATDKKTSVVTTEINIDGEEANAGGRSGTLVFDGMLNCSVGANSVDRQSLWLDLQGGMISRIGRDKNNISVCSQLDGSMFVQLGSSGTPLDKRFTTKKGFTSDANINVIFEIRVITENNRFHRFRMDNSGILFQTPGSFRVLAAGEVELHGSNIQNNAEHIVDYGSYFDPNKWMVSRDDTGDGRPMTTQNEFVPDGDTGPSTIV